MAAVLGQFLIFEMGLDGVEPSGARRPPDLQSGIAPYETTTPEVLLRSGVNSSVQVA